VNKSLEVKIRYDKSNIYCFDNEAYRYLALVKNGIQQVGNNKEFSMSWQKSSENLRKLVDIVETFKPFGTEETILFNKVQEESQALFKSAADIVLQIVKRIEIINVGSRKQANAEPEEKYWILKLNKILIACAGCSNVLRNNCLAIFNDDFEAFLDENRRDCINKEPFGNNISGISTKIEECVKQYDKLRNCTKICSNLNFLNKNPLEKLLKDISNQLNN
jgi:hypothetical protein